MCGIVGIFRFDGKEADETSLQSATACLSKRGPDAKGVYIHQQVGLGHTRLAIIDLDPSSNQPFHDNTGRYTLLFNGEIFNYRTLRKDLASKGIQFRTKSDTEVLLQLLILEGPGCLNKLNGFFALAFYDKLTQKILLARDRYGVKPLYYFQNESFFAFASEMKALMALGIPKNLDYSSLLFYFQLNYIPSPHSVLEDVQKLPPSHWLSLSRDTFIPPTSYYSISTLESGSSYEEKKRTLKDLLSESVKDRLVSDVPLGVFLSGGVDSSIVSLLAKRHSSDIHSFSIGFKDAKFYDESEYAQKVAKHLHLQHHTFYLTNQEMLESLDDMLSYIDEPFADSSSIAVYNLCKQTRPHVTVALTGDGADEVFGGYNKHLAEAKIRRKNFLNLAMRLSSPLFRQLPESRSGLWGNEFRKIKKYSRSVGLSEAERYWRWCSFSQEEDALQLFAKPLRDRFVAYDDRRSNITRSITGKNFHEILEADLKLVLEGDMLVKTDRMSMANSLELRNPFLDSRVVDFAFTLKDNDKIQHTAKKILKETFASDLPHEVFARPKHGFEVPLLKWFKEDLQSRLHDYLHPDLLNEQGIFDIDYISQLKRKLYSNQPGDVPQRMWGILVFQCWWGKYFNN